MSKYVHVAQLADLCPGRPIKTAYLVCLLRQPHGFAGFHQFQQNSPVSPWQEQSLKDPTVGVQ